MPLRCCCQMRFSHDFQVPVERNERTPQTFEGELLEFARQQLGKIGRFDAERPNPAQQL
jgi:hypothetical protein